MGWEYLFFTEHWEKCRRCYIPKIKFFGQWTNNISTDSPESKAATISEIVSYISCSYPWARYLILEILPRSIPASPLRAKASLVNQFLLSDPTISGSVIISNAACLRPDNSLNPELYYHDKLHLSHKGYRLLATLVLDKLGHGKCRWI